MFLKTKKIITVFLTVAMLFSFMGVTSLAEELTYTYNIDGNGTLTISGTGKLPFVWGSSKTPWESEAEKITSLVVSEGITSLGECAFDDLTYLRSVTLPNSLEEIGSHSFDGCKFLENITLPKNLKTIGLAAFINCSSLSEITIPESVVTIERGETFSGCSSLKKAVFNNSLATLPDSFFRNCTLLTEVTLPKSLANIGGYSFYNCTSLKKIVIPETVTILGGGAFEGCTSLQEVNTKNILKYDGNRNFSGCSSLDTVEINETVKEIPALMFENSGITHLVLPENLQKIGMDAFNGCSKLETVNIPKNLKNLKTRAFQGCTSLKEFSMPVNIKRIESSFFEGCTSLSTVILHDDVTNIGNNAFKNCSSLKNITLPKNIEYIGYEAFTGTGIKEITIPKSLKTAGHGTGFSHSMPYDYNKGPFGDSPLETAYFENGTTKIPDGLFQGAKMLKNVNLSNIESIGAYAFSNCTEFVPVITNKTKEIGNYAFANCSSIENFEIPTCMEKIPNGLLAGTNVGYVVFPKTVKEIGEDAYHSCKKLSYIEFSDSVTDIGSSAFYGCTALDKINIPGTVINIGSSAFENCTNLKELIMHKGTQTLGGSAFANCALKVVRPSQTIRKLNDDMFNDNPIEVLVVPRFCTEWNGWGNSYNNFNPIVSYVPANVKTFDIWMYDNATIKGVEGTAGQEEATASENVTFEAVRNGIDQLSFDKKNVDISLDDTYDSASLVTIVSEVTTDPTTGRTEMDGEFIFFTSDNENVATVDSTGYVHGVGYGTANITISCTSGITDVLTVNVVRPSVGVAVSSGYEKLSVGSSVTLTADTIPAGYEENYTWASSDDEIATVTQDGVVCAKKEGTAIISVTGEYSKKTAKCIVTVTSENTLPYKIDIDGFVIGCDVALTEAENGGDVIAALYDSNDKLLATNVYPASDKVRVDFTVLPTMDLTGAKIKVFWWNVELIKPISSFRLIEME